MLLNPKSIPIPAIWTTPRQREMYVLGYVEAHADECSGFLWASLRHRSKAAYEAGREAGYAKRMGWSPPNPFGTLEGAQPVLPPDASQPPPSGRG